MKALRGLFGAGKPGAIDNSEVVHILEPKPRGAQEGMLAVVAIYRNEAAYIAEWIAYHRLIGVDKFFLYDNETTDETNRILAPHVASGLVEITPWPHFMAGVNTQAAAYAHAIARLAGRFKWLAIIDIDEFLVPARRERLPDILRDYEAYPAVMLYWHMFGPNGHRTRPEAGVIASYTQRQKMPDEGGLPAEDGKRIYKTKYLVQPLLARNHVASHTVGTTALPLLGFNDMGKPVRQMGDGVSGARLRINHYFTKSEAELEAKLAGHRIAKHGARRSASRVNEVLAGFAAGNCIEDRVIIDLVDHLGGLGQIA